MEALTEDRGTSTWPAAADARQILSRRCARRSAETFQHALAAVGKQLYRDAIHRKQGNTENGVGFTTRPFVERKTNPLPRFRPSEGRPTRQHGPLAKQIMVNEDFEEEAAALVPQRRDQIGLSHIGVCAWNSKRAVEETRKREQGFASLCNPLTLAIS